MLLFALRQSLHQPEVDRHEQRCRAEPRQGVRQADARIAQAIWRKQRGKADRAEDAHDKLYHAGLKRRAAVAHALDGGAENHQQAEDDIERADGEEIAVGIPDDLGGGRIQKQRNDEVTAAEQQRAHEHVAQLDLHKAGAHALAYAAVLPRAVVLRDIA